MTKGTEDWLTPDVVTLLDLTKVLADNATLMSVCSDGNSSVQYVARDLALSVMDYVNAKRRNPT